MNRPLDDIDKYPLLSNLTTDPRLVGGSSLLNPLIQHTSSQRVNMFTNNINQHMVLHDSEPPIVSSGYEHEFSKYTFNPTRFTQPSRVLAVIPKYRSGIGTDPINDTPRYTVIYLGMEDNKIHCMEVTKFSSLTAGFGYENEINYSKMRTDSYFEKDDVLAHSHSVQDGFYNMGLNANVCYLSMRETVQDAFCISESLAERLKTSGYRTYIIPISKDQVPLNLYGDDDQYKFFPDIGEIVRRDNILCGFRNVNNSVMTDFSESALKKYQEMHDTLCFVDHADCEVVDVDVRINPNKKIKTNEYIFTQLNKYQEETTVYYETVLKHYEELCVKNKYQEGDSFNTLVFRAGSHMLARGRRVLGVDRRSAVKYSRKAEPIAFIELSITVKYANHVSLGSKIVSRYGSKGVVSSILKDEDCPINEFGIKADLIVDPISVPNRMNLGQLYEHFISYCSGFVLRKMRTMEPLDAYEYMLEFLGDVNPPYVNTIKTVVNNKDENKLAFVKESLDKDMLIVVVPSFVNTFSPKWCLFMTEKYGVHNTKLKYNLRNADGTLNRVVETLTTHCISKKYIYILCKIPTTRSSGITHVNQHGMPVKHKSKNMIYPTKTTPVRLGEDEFRLISMCTGSDVAARILSLYSNSLEGVNLMVEEQLTNPHPSRIEWFGISNDDLLKSNRAIQLSHHMLHTAGVDSIHVDISKKDANKIKQMIFGSYITNA